MPGSADDIELAPEAAPSPPAPLPRCAGERGEFDPASTGFVPFSLPAQFAGEGRGEGGACRSPRPPPAAQSFLTVPFL
jgi:hypothetical protein